MANKHEAYNGLMDCMIIPSLPKEPCPADAACRHGDTARLRDRQACITDMLCRVAYLSLCRRYSPDECLPALVYKLHSPK